MQGEVVYIDKRSKFANKIVRSLHEFTKTYHIQATDVKDRFLYKFAKKYYPKYKYLGCGSSRMAVGLNHYVVGKIAEQYKSCGDDEYSCYENDNELKVFLNNPTLCIKPIVLYSYKKYSLIFTQRVHKTFSHISQLDETLRHEFDNLGSYFCDCHIYNVGVINNKLRLLDGSEG